MFSKEEAQLLRKEFWSSFGDYTKFFSKKVGEPVVWVLYRTGVKGLELKFDIEYDAVRVVLEVNAKDENRRFDIFVELDQYKPILTKDLSDDLIWDEEFLLPEDKLVSRVYIECQGVKYHNRDNWPDIYRFMAENMYKLQQNFMDIQDILIEKFGK